MQKIICTSKQYDKHKTQYINPSNNIINLFYSDRRIRWRL